MLFDFPSLIFKIIILPVAETQWKQLWAQKQLPKVFCKEGCS